MKFSLLLTSLLSFVITVHSQGILTAELDYGTFQGAYSKEYDISYWMKIPFAAPPIGQNRFRAPQPPLQITNGTYNSTQTYDYCPQRTVNGTEDCLYLGLYGRPWTRGQPLKPVVVVFHGGAFIQGGGSFSIPPSGYPTLNVSGQNDFIFVYTNYRLNAFGFLPGRQIAEDIHSDLNVGLLDQQAALQWTNKYVSHFGGDPKNVTIWGQSAGGGSVVAQVIANGGRTEPRLFSDSLISSPFWPKTYDCNAPEAQSIYDRFAALAGCSGDDSLACLKSADLQALRSAALNISTQTYTTQSHTWAPVIDGAFIQEPLSQATAKGKVNIDDGFGMYNLHEGENFIPPGFANATGAISAGVLYNSSMASFDNWLAGFLPGFNARDLQQARELYPPSGMAEELVYNTTLVRAGVVYRDTVLACPALWTAFASREHSYLGEYTISPAKHASDTVYWNQVNAIQKEDPLIYEGYAGAFASFFQTGDPNAHKLTNHSQSGVPEYFESDGKQLIVQADGLKMGTTESLRRRCEFWRGKASKIPI